MRHAALALATAALLTPQMAAADIVIVDFDGVGSIFTHIQEGIDAASDGDEVWVLSFVSTSAVTFRGLGNTDLDLSGKNITIVATEGPGQTIIDCEGDSRAFICGDVVDSTSVISGFTIQNGFSPDDGGAIYCEGGSPRIENCRFRGNEAQSGGAIRLSGGTTRVSGCTFYGNDASNLGGAIYSSGAELYLRSCTFSDNEATRGGAVAVRDAALGATRNTFANNSGVYGSSLWLDDCPALIDQCVLAFGREGSAVWSDPPLPETLHSCVYGNEDGDSIPGDAHDNLNEDPLLCDVYAPSGGNMSVCSNSPCLPANNVWLLPIGSKAQGCGDCGSPVVESTWGSIKALFR